MGLMINGPGYHQPADPGTDKIGRFLFNDAWVVSNAQVAAVGKFIQDSGGADRAMAAAEAGARKASSPLLATQAGLGGALGALGGVVGRVASSPVVRKAARSIVKVAGGWMVWNGAEWVFSALRPDGAPASRRMNMMNVRALKRADRRVQGFAQRAVPVLKQLGYEVERHKRPGSKRRHTHADHHPPKGYNSREWMAHIRGMRKGK